MLRSLLVRTRVLAMCMLVLALSLTPAFAGHGDGDHQVKKGILLVAFGTSIPEAQKSFDSIEDKVKSVIPGVPVRWAFTSNIIRHKLAGQGQVLDSVPTALAKMLDEGFTHVAVQSLHTIPGEEYHLKVLSVVNRFKGAHGGFEQISVGRPLMSTDADMDAVADGIMKVIPAERKKGEAVVLMGHGTHHFGNIFYPGLQWYMAQRDANIFVGTVEGTPSLDYVVDELKSKGIKKAWLMPMMSVAGDHARNDMAGSEDDSWKSVLESKGIAVEAILKGTAEYDVFAGIWADHAKNAFAKLAE